VLVEREGYVDVDTGQAVDQDEIDWDNRRDDPHAQPEDGMPAPWSDAQSR
jgi:hypothetical protein